MRKRMRKFMRGVEQIHFLVLYLAEAIKFDGGGGGAHIHKNMV